MRQIAFYFFGTLALASCTETPPLIPSGFSERTVCLVDSFPLKTLAYVKMAVPVELNTLLNWTDFSDCVPCCNTEKYRFTASNGCLIQESGFFHSRFCRDSIRRLTIMHTDWGCGDETKIDTALANKVAGSLEVRKNYGNPLEWKRKEIQKINGHDFALYHYIGADSYAADIEIVEAITLVEGGLITFQWECTGFSDCEMFTRKAFQTLASIQIDTICTQ